MERRIRTAVYFPDGLKKQLANLSDATGKSVNSIVIDSCLQYVQEFRHKYAFLFENESKVKSKKGASENAKNYKN